MSQVASSLQVTLGVINQVDMSSGVYMGGWQRLEGQGVSRRGQRMCPLTIHTSYEYSMMHFTNTGLIHHT